MTSTTIKPTLNIRIGTHMSPLLKLPIGIQDFRKLREDGFVYVDKTKYIYQLLQEGTVYFLSRPRRFGRSLLVSTIEAIFKGQRELFKDTWIDASEYAWAEYPVIRIDMSRVDRTSPENFSHSMRRVLHEIAQNYGVSIPNEKQAIHDLLDTLIILLSEKNKVVGLCRKFFFLFSKIVDVFLPGETMPLTHKTAQTPLSFYYQCAGFS